MVIMIRSLVSTVLLTLVSWPRDVHSVPIPTLGIFSQCVGTIEECLERAQGMYPLCTDCAQFVVCSAQSSTIMNCTPSTLYDASLGVCNFPGLAVCGTNNTTTTTTATVTTPDTAAQIVSEQTVFGDCVDGVEQCEDAGRRSGQYPHCSDCAKFIKCNGAVKVSAVITCQGSLQYDVNLGVCTFFSGAVCGTNTITATTPDTAAQIVPEQTVFGDCVDGVEQCEDAGRRSGQYPHCSDCAKFIKCNGAVNASAVLTCQGGMQYDVNLGVCTIFSEAVCGTNANNTATTPDTAAQIMPEQTVFRDCVDGVEQCEDAGRRSGQYPHCSDCAKFIKCNGAVNASAVLTCQGGMQYDVNLGVCTIFSEAVCGTNANNTATTPDTAAQIVPEQTVFGDCVDGLEQCEDAGRRSGQYPHCSDCAKFIKCNGAVNASAVVTCQGGMQYDVNLGVCTIFSEAVCGTNTNNTATTPDTAAQIVPEQTVFGDCVDGVEQCEDVGRRSGHYPHCLDCAKFIKCNDAVNASTVVTCQVGLQYDVNLGVCTIFSEAVCGTNTNNTATTPDTAAQIVPEQTVFGDCVDGVEQCEDAGRRSGQYPHCSDCAKFIKCNGAVNASAVVSCQGVLQYDVNLGVCTFFSKAVCGTNTNNTATTPDTAAQIVPEQTVFGDCVDGVEQCEDAGRRSGQYPHCSDCAKFIKCNGAVNASAVVTCQGVMQYDVNLGVCTFFLQAVCGTNTDEMK